VLRPSGILVFSCHNLRYKKAFSDPQLRWSTNPVRLAVNCAGYVLSLWNYLHVAPLRTTTSEYALLNDPGHRYACLHYYAARSTVCAQLVSAGLRCVETFDRRGQVLVESADDGETSSILYVAERRQIDTGLGIDGSFKLSYSHRAKIRLPGRHERDLASAAMIMLARFQWKR